MTEPQTRTKYTYDSFGKLSASSGSLTNPFQYTAREAGRRSYYRARYYDPSVGRFVSEDPLRFDRGDVDFYAYVRNSSLIAIDLWGQSFLVFDRATGTLSAFDKNGNWVFSCEAGNKTPANYKPGHWPDGTYKYLHHNFHAPDENSAFGLHGIYVFDVPGRDPGMGVHSGRKNRGGPKYPTHGCVRTTDNCMDQIGNLNGKDPLTGIAIE